MPAPLLRSAVRIASGIQRACNNYPQRQGCDGRVILDALLGSSIGGMMAIVMDRHRARIDGGSSEVLGWEAVVKFEWASRGLRRKSPQAR